MLHRSNVLLTSALVALGFVGLGFNSGLDRNGDEGDRVAYTVDAVHSKISFKVRHLGLSSVRGEFADFDVNLSMIPEDISSLQASSTIHVNSISTGAERRDGHLRSADFFDAENHPTITFTSTEVRAAEDGSFQLAGELTIRGVTKPVVLDAEMIGPVVGPMGKERIGFEATGTINRKDFGLLWDSVTEAGGIIVGHNVTMILEIEAIRN